MTVAAEKDFVSIGQLAAHLQKPVRAIERAADVLGMSPALRLNLIPYYAAEQVETLTEHLNHQPTKETR